MMVGTVSLSPKFCSASRNALVDSALPGTHDSNEFFWTSPSLPASGMASAINANQNTTTSHLSRRPAGSAAIRSLTDMETPLCGSAPDTSVSILTGADRTGVDPATALALRRRQDRRGPHYSPGSRGTPTARSMPTWFAEPYGEEVTLTSRPRPSQAGTGARGSEPYPPWPFGPAVWAWQDRRPPWPVLVLPMVALAVLQIVGTKLAADNQPDAKTLDWLGYALLVAGPAALSLRRHFPVPVLVSVAVITLGYLSLGYPYGPIFLSLVGAVFSAVLSGYRRAAWATVGLGFLAYAALTYTVNADRGSPPWHLAGVFAWLLVMIVVAELARSRRERFAEAMRTRAEEGRRRASEERLGFARELHDVLAHNISLINVQAGVALHLIDTQPEQARAALAAIKDASKETLRELRATLGVLRQVDEGAPRAPAPSLARLDELIARLGAAGLTVRTRVEGTPVPLPARVDLAAYRIVQEALTNVYRHAGGVTATVELRYAEDELVIQIDNDAGPAGGSAAAAGAGLPSTGAGIAGMRERAETLGGQLSAGPRPDGGFRVRARLPLDGAL